MKTIFFIMMLFFIKISSQNMAVTSGAWSNCATWGSTGVIYRNTSDTKIINNGVTVTADAVWSTAALAMNSSGSVNMNSGIFIDLMNDQGPDVICDKIYAAIQSAGCASCGAYNNAYPNQYIRITEAEYNAIRNQLSNVTLAGSTDAQINSVYTTMAPAGFTQSIAPSQAKVPASSYIPAFTVFLDGTVNLGTPRAVKVKYNTSASMTTGYADYGGGNNFSFIVPASGKYYFVIKQPAQTTFSGGVSYLALTNNVGIGVEFYGVENVGRSMGDTNTLGTVNNYRIAFQAVVTPVKQW